LTSSQMREAFKNKQNKKFEFEQKCLPEAQEDFRNNLPKGKLRFKTFLK